MAEERKEVQQKYDRMFADERKTPTAWSIGRGVFSCLSFASEVYKRSEAEIIAAARREGFRKSGTSGIVSFDIRSAT